MRINKKLLPRFMKKHIQTREEWDSTSKKYETVEEYIIIRCGEGAVLVTVFSFLICLLVSAVIAAAIHEERDQRKGSEFDTKTCTQLAQGKRSYVRGTQCKIVDGGNIKTIEL